MKPSQQRDLIFGSIILFSFLAAYPGVFAQVQPETVWKSQATNSYVSNPLAISPDGTLAATLGSNDTVQLWSTSTGNKLLALSGHSSWIGDLSFSPDGAYLASGGGDKVVRVWRTTNWSLAYTIATTSQGPPVAFSPDSATLAVGNGPNIELRNATNGNLLHTWLGTPGWWLTALAFSPDGTRLASGAGARGVDTMLRIWEIPGGLPLLSVPTAQTYSILRVVFSPDGQQVLTCGSSTLQSWNVLDGTILRAFQDPAYSAAFSADGSVLATVWTNIVFRRSSDGVVIQNYPDGFASHTAGEKGIGITSAGGLFIRSRGFGEVLAGLVPVLVSPPSVELDSLNIQWVGGSGRYQLQCASDPGGDWEDEGGILTTNWTTVTIAKTNIFFRVLDIPQSP